MYIITIASVELSGKEPGYCHLDIWKFHLYESNFDRILFESTMQFP